MKYTIQASKEPGWWVVTDTENSAKCANKTLRELYKHTITD